MYVQVWSTQGKPMSRGMQWKPRGTCVVVKWKVKFPVDERETGADFAVDVWRGAVSVDGYGKALLFIFTTSVNTLL